jgi:NDP-sugar pyrophosphorylase family protein
MNSDLFTNINYEDFFLHFEENEADMSVAAVPYSVSVPYGIFNLNGRDILGIKEKPSYNYYANAGIYLIKRELLDLIPDNKFFNATDFMELLIARNHKVIRFPLTGYWIDIGKHEDYKKAQELVKHL